MNIPRVLTNILDKIRSRFTFAFDMVQSSQFCFVPRFRPVREINEQRVRSEFSLGGGRG